MLETEECHRRQIQSIGVAANRKAVSITCKSTHLTALTCPLLTVERLTETESFCQGRPAANETDDCGDE